MKTRRLMGIALVAAMILASAGYATEVRANKKSKKYHVPACKHYASKGSTESFESEQAAEKAGYKACKKCGTAMAAKKAAAVK